MKKSNLPFGKKNYRIMLIGLGVLVLGFILMSMDSSEFGFGVLGLWVGPLTILAGFGIQFLAILTHDDVPVLEKPSAAKSSLKAKDATRSATAEKKTANVKRKGVSSKKRKKASR